MTTKSAKYKKPNEGSRIKIDPVVADVVRFAARRDGLETSDFIAGLVRTRTDYGELARLSRSLRAKARKNEEKTKAVEYPPVDTLDSNISSRENAEDVEQVPIVTEIFSLLIKAWQRCLPEAPDAMTDDDAVSLCEIHFSAERMAPAEPGALFERWVRAYAASGPVEPSPRDLLLNLHRYVIGG